MVGTSALSGAQRKLSVRLDSSRMTLQVATTGGRFILKPQTNVYPELPENEHLTMHLAALAGLNVAPNGLLPLEDGSIAYVVRRFDRRNDGSKRHHEAFCQLAEKPAREKYEGSAELLVRLLRTHATEPLVELLKLFRLCVAAWWTGNGDMHLKNVSILRDDDERYRLSPVYDFVCTRLVIDRDQLALSIGGKRDRMRQSDWIRFAACAAIPERAAVRVLKSIAKRGHAALHAVHSSFLSSKMKQQYLKLIGERSQLLEAD